MSTPIEPPPASLHLLAFDTSTERLAIAVSDGRRRWSLDVEGGTAASATLVPQLQACLAQAGLSLSDVDAIAFGSGPGAFTGLRTACAVAQGLAFGLDKPLLPTDSLLIVAEDARQQSRQQGCQQAHPDAGAAAGQEMPSMPTDAGDFEVAVAMDARMTEVYAAHYRHVRSPAAPHGVWQVLQAPALVPLADLAAHWNTTPTAMAGSALSAFGAATVLPPGAKAFATVLDRAAALLRLAQVAARAGGGVDAAAGLPLYLRDKVAQTTAERAALKAGQPVALQTLLEAAPSKTP
ncbi:MAG: tRNA (adenosine(37)-N6)-threonylcarbamoyltransferase complex dimerization subunit type 1 TsaB [Rubrivivax sp.]